MTDRYENIRRALAECRDIAMEWTMRGRIPECGKFGEIAQNLGAVCAELEWRGIAMNTHDIERPPDDVAVDAFAAAMKAKLKRAREEKGRGGWQDMSATELSAMLREHVEKGDPVDVANLAMMLHQNGQGITPAEPWHSQGYSTAHLKPWNLSKRHVWEFLLGQSTSTPPHNPPSR
jgi:hypothetical protein